MLQRKKDQLKKKEPNQPTIAELSKKSPAQSKKRDPEQVPMKKAPEAKKKLRIRLKESSVENLARSDANASFSSSRFPILQTAIQCIYKSMPTSCSLEELYRITEEICGNKFAAELYSAVRVEMESHIGSLGRQMHTAATSMSHDAFLHQLNQVWSRHCEDTQMIRQIVLTLDRTYALEQRSQGVQSLWDLGVFLFGRHVLQSQAVFEKTIQGLLSLIERERRGEDVPRALISSLLRMLSALSIYGSAFEPVFLEHTKKYYATEMIEKLASPDTAVYLHWVYARLREESDRVSNYLQEASRRPLLVTVESELLSQRSLEVVIENGLDVLLDENRFDDLKLLYALFSRVNQLPMLQIGFNSYLKRVGVEIVADKDRDKTMVEDLLQLKLRCAAVISTCFQNHAEFYEAEKKAFEHLINVRPNKPAELLAKFVDNLFKNSKLSDDEMEALLERVMVLFRYINGKDVFEAFYKKDLAKRLLLSRSVSPEWEQLMIKNLKNECGSVYTTKMEGMFKDMEQSKALMSEFGTSKKGAQCPLQLSLNVLTAGYWPTYVLQPVTLPPIFVQTCQIFEQFYGQKHESRRLSWHHSLAYVTLGAHYPKGIKKQFHVSLFQAVVLLQFNDADSICLKDIGVQSGLDQEELVRTVKSLSLGKVRVLVRAPGISDSDPIGENELFSWKKDFKHKMLRIKINSIQVQETVEENDQVREAVQRDRKYQIDAAIVRIMKTRRSLSHSQLLAEIYTQIKFPVKPADIKKQIESLIDREYLARDEKAQAYNYLA